MTRIGRLLAVYDPSEIKRFIGIKLFFVTVGMQERRRIEAPQKRKSLA
jgi:hypothetical protein